MNKLKIAGIYKITSPSGRVNIGQSWDINDRWYKYKRYDCKNQPKLYRSFLKYGIENHTFEIIWRMPNTSQELLDFMETLFINFYKAIGEVHNIRLGGSRGKHAEESKQKMAEAKKGKKRGKHSEETKMKMSEAAKGKNKSKEAIRKTAESNRGRKHTEEAKRNMSEAGKGKKISEEQKCKISQSSKGKKMSEEARRKMSEAAKGRKVTEKQIAALRNANERRRLLKQAA